MRDRVLNVSRESERAIANIQEQSGVCLSDCYQCGKCTGSCPFASAMDLMPRQVIRYLQLGLWEDVLKCNSVWMCENCQTCLARCPHEVDLPSLMEAVRHEAKSQGIVNGDIDKFANIFVSNIKRFGMSNEMLLSGLYNLRTGHFTQDIMSAPQLFKNQKLKIKPHTVKDKASIARLFQKSLGKGGK